MPDRRRLITAGLAAGAVLLARQAAIAAPTGGTAGARVPRPNPMPEALRQDLERDPHAPVLWNPTGDITLTQFTDYNCQFCRKMVRTVHRLAQDDPKLRVVFREWPVFGEGSEFAARAALAATAQQQYWPMHKALMALRGRAEEASVLRVAGALKLDMDRLRQDMDSDRVLGEIEQTFALADHMQLKGTPTYIAGDEAMFGEQSPTQLKDLIARSRAILAA